MKIINYYKDSIMMAMDNWRDKRRGIYPVVRDLNYDFTQNQKRVLICILDYEKICKAKYSHILHTNIQEMFQMIRQLILMDYVIDICGHDAVRALDVLYPMKYDLILGMGEVFRRIVPDQKMALKVLYMTENPYNISSIKEQERIQYFYKRHGKKTGYSRSGKYYLENDEKLADAIITLGNKKYLEDSNKQVFSLYPSALVNKDIKIQVEKRKKTNFLVFGAGGIIHKGIDILVDVFSERKDCTLYICGNNVSMEMKKLGLRKFPNIIDCGFIDINSSEFKELAEKCFFTLLLSCSEGTPTGIITCMCHGMIPVVTAECNLNDYDEFCYYFDDYHTESVNKILDFILEEPNSLLTEKSIKVREFANKNFSLKEYSKNIFRILNIITESEIN